MFDSSRQRVPERHAVGSAVVVGASLSGLMTALVLSRNGLEVDLLERSADSGRTGAALYVEPNLVQRLTGSEPAPEHRLDPGVQTWHSVHKALLGVADADPRIRVRPDTMVTSAAQGTGSAWVTTHSGEVVSGDIVIGADGHRSTVRAAVAPERPDATFAGYLIWLGLLDESAIEGDHPRVSGTVFLDGTLGPLLGGPLPGPTGSNAPGYRQLFWAWYDASHNGLLRRQGAVVGNVVRHTVIATDIPEETYEELAAEAKRSFKSPWRDAIVECIERRAVIGTPIAEYVPTRLVNGRIALVGDAAHVPTPMTGNGFSASMQDAEALATAITKSRRSAAKALELYEEARLESACRLVQSGQQFSRSFSRRAA
jgi:2-polyprenyl-6-methoxyphenol hydroxylase-like FAD-dependent oxidoreductase